LPLKHLKTHFNETLFSVLPAWLILVMAIVFSFIITYIAFKILRKVFTSEELEKFKEVTGIYVSMIGILYGVFLAFIVIASGKIMTM